ncbi:MAG: phage recombination protein Bet [Metallibacterium sp.]
MSNELTVMQKKQIATQDFERSANEYLSMLGFKYTPDEAKKFLEICQAFQLNPFKHEIYGIKGWDSEHGKDILTIIVGYESYLKRAERTQLLDGWDKSVEKDENGNIMSATITIYRKDRKYPFKHTVYFNEFARRKKDGSLMKNWATMPVFMLEKVVIAQGFRMCFPDEMGGLPYIEEEIQEIILNEDKGNAKPFVEMPKEKVTEKEKVIDAEFTEQKSNEKQKAKEPITFTEEAIAKVFTDIQASVNADELAKIWKENSALIKGVPAEIKKQLTECKDVQKQNLTSILTAEA